MWGLADIRRAWFMPCMAQAFTILYVEDDVLIRDPLVELLSLKGFHILPAEDGHAAMRILAEEHVDVLFTDVVMPGLSGIELAKQARRLQPHLKVIFATGHAVRAHEAAQIGKLLIKPLRAQQIEVELRELLACMSATPHQI
jgi:DNA-binding NtrC family response regulator